MKKIFKSILNFFQTMSITLGCMLGIHAWKNGRCVNCGKRR